MESRFIILLFLPALSHALYFYIGETERKCFIEELPDETTVQIKYKIEGYDPQTNAVVEPSHALAIFFEVKDSAQKDILSRPYSMEGIVTFTASNPGEHSICLKSNSSSWFSGGRLRVHLDIEVGEHTIDYHKLAQKEKLSELQIRIRQLIDQVDQIKKEQNYQRFREERFRETSESTNKRVLYWALAQTLLLVLTGFWQMRHLKSFFEAKKLV